MWFAPLLVAEITTAFPIAPELTIHVLKTVLAIRTVSKDVHAQKRMSSVYLKLSWSVMKNLIMNSINVTMRCKQGCLIVLQPEYNPGVISTNKTQLNGSCYDNHWVENLNPIQYDDCYHGMITHKNHYLNSGSMTPQYCIEKCERDRDYAYAAVAWGNECWCGNQPPYETLYECRIP